MLKVTVLLFLLLSCLNIHKAYADEVVEMQKQLQTKSVGVSASNTSIAISSQKSSSPDPSPVLKTENSDFEAKGKITSISGDNFDIEGITITKSPNYLTLILGNIEVGKVAEVKGVLEKGLRFAKEIRMEGSAQPSNSPSAPVKTDQPLKTEISKPQAPNTSNAQPVVLGNRTEPAKPIMKPLSANNALIGDQNVPLPIPSATPLPSAKNEKPAQQFINPVISFFENLFKDWF